MRKTLSLGRIALEYPLILFDSSALMNKRNNLFEEFFEDKGGQYLSLLTKGVFDEYHEYSPSFLERRKVRWLKKKILSYGKVLELKEDEKLIHRILIKKYVHFREDFGISEVDLDLIISGAVISVTRKNTAIISNDNGIFNSWSYFLDLEEKYQKSLGFFYRVSYNRFSVTK